MKKLFTIILLGATTVAFAQKDNVGIGTTQPDQSAILDLSSSTKGFLTPRMTQVQRDLILSPAQGLQIFQTDEKAGLYIFDGQKWVNSTAGTSASIDPWLGGGNTANGTDFIGTLNTQDLRFRVANIPSGRLATNGSMYLGSNAGNSSSGIANVALGGQALRDNTSGTFNMAIGTGALQANTIGVSNVAIGNSAMAANVGNATTGSRNVAIGTNAMYQKTAGESNVAIGHSALGAGGTGSFSVAIGRGAGQNATGDRNVLLGYNAGQNATGSDQLYIASSNTNSPLVYGDFNAKNLKFHIGATGKVVIGDALSLTSSSGANSTPTGYKLYVQGGIITEKVKVALSSSTSDWSDYVFEKEYKDNMMSLEEVEKFTLEHKHLPNVPSAEEMVTSGLDVAATSKMFMEKIEELTLYIIELNKEITKLKGKNN